MANRIFIFLLVFLFIPLYFVSAQEGPQSDDTTKLLKEVVVHAYLYDRPMNEVPAAIAVVSHQDFERFNNTSILPAVNTIPGVRMEERSPGSYRFSIRGSLLRSPFGVRNVKVYWNGLPLTDGGGNTYLNLLDFNAISNSEIIKGPGASLYGAGTGGVVLLNKEISQQPGLRFSTVIGSYGLQRYQLSGQAGTEKTKVSIQYAHQEADGYREQTKMNRDALNMDVSFVLNSRSTLTGSIFYTDLLYETPGGLTKAQYDENPGKQDHQKHLRLPYRALWKQKRLFEIRRYMQELRMTMSGMTTGQQKPVSMDRLLILKILPFAIMKPVMKTM